MSFIKNIFLVAILISVFSAAPAKADKLRALYGDGSVRFTSVGPVSLNSDQNILIGLLLPAVKSASATIMLVDNDGDILATKTVTIPDGFTKSFFGVNYTISTSDQGVVTLTDGTTTETIGDLTTSSNVNALIGLLLPAVQKVREAAARQHVGSLQIVNKRSGVIVSLLPFVEQSVLAKTIQISKR